MSEKVPEPGEVEDMDLGIPGDAEPMPEGDADDNVDEEAGEDG